MVQELSRAGVSAVSHDTQVLSPGYLHLSVSVLPTRSRKDCLRSNGGGSAASPAKLPTGESWVQNVRE